MSTGIVQHTRRLKNTIKLPVNDVTGTEQPLGKGRLEEPPNLKSGFAQAHEPIRRTESRDEPVGF